MKKCTRHVRDKNDILFLISNIYKIKNQLIVHRRFIFDSMRISFINTELLLFEHNHRCDDHSKDKASCKPVEECFLFKVLEI